VSQFFQGAFALALLALVLKQMVELMLGGGLDRNTGNKWKVIVKMKTWS
jgi:hypothetical protein